MLRMAHQEAGQDLKAAVRPVDLFYKTYLNEENPSYTALTVTMIYHQNLYPGILHFRVNSRKSKFNQSL